MTKYLDSQWDNLEYGDIFEIGQKTNDLKDIQAQYIGLMKFRGNGIREMLKICDEAKQRSESGKELRRTNRTYNKMYMTDLLQGMILEVN